MTARRLGRRASAVAFAVAMVALPVPDAYGQPAAAETVVDIRVHGNHTTPDDDVVAVAGVAVGDVVDLDVAEAVTRRLEASGRFETVEVRKRYRSLTATDRIALVIVVRERPRASIGNPVVRALARISRQSMFLPIVRYDEGYGMSYGARFSLVDVLGPGSRLSTPLTWGGDRRAGLEAEWPTAGGVVDRVRGGSSYGRRVHPFFGADDQRTRFWAAVDRGLGPGLRLGVEAAREEVRFRARADRLTRLTVGLEYGGFSPGAFPRDDVRVSAAVERLSVAGRPAAIVRPRIDAQAFKGVGGQAVLAARVLFEGASTALPPYEQTLLGGGGNLRGWRVGSRVGDRLMAASVELRLPMSSPLSIGNAGFRIFYDTAAAYDVGQSLRGARFLAGAGGGVFLTLPPFASVHLDIGHDFRGSLRLHAGAGVGF